ncbi:MAG: bifunctional DNA primase/polymerase, partial [Stackebrandtia sp.]
VLALRTGAPSGTVVIDVDPRNGGAQSLAELLAVDALPATLTARTGSGGLHFYYAHPGGTVKSGANRLGAGIDAKADGAYVVLAPSTYDGRSYRWESGDPGEPLPVLPGDLAAQLSADVPPAPRRLAPPTAPAGGFAAPRTDPGRLTGIVSVLLSAPEGSRNEVLNWASYTAAELVRTGAAPAEAVIGALTEASEAIGLSPAETRGTIRSGLRAGGVA